MDFVTPTNYFYFLTSDFFHAIGDSFQSIGKRVVKCGCEENDVSLGVSSLMCL